MSKSHQKNGQQQQKQQPQQQQQQQIQPQQQKSVISFPNFSNFRFPSLFRVPGFLEDVGSSINQLFTEQTGLTVSEDKKNIYVEAALPGLDANDIDISLDQGILWIKGDKTEEEGGEDRTYYHKASSSFSYRFALPSQVDSSKEPTATYRDGIMRITFPKSSQTQSKKIQIKR